MFIAAYDAHGSCRAAAKALKIPLSTYHGRLARERRDTRMPRIDYLGNSQKSDGYDRRHPRERLIDIFPPGVFPDPGENPIQRGHQSQHRHWYEANNRVLHDADGILELE